MNQYSTAKKSNHSKTEISRGEGRKSGSFSFFWFFFGLMAALIVVACSICGRLYLNEKTEELARERQRVSAMITEMQAEIQTLLIKRSSLCSWENVSSKIRTYNLSLHAADPNQIRYMKRAADGGMYYGTRDERVADNHPVNPSIY